tara:strand:- start:989 stop:2206 length:1218 start_codon:yes stop_codon:yes gene_type:complete
MKYYVELPEVWIVEFLDDDPNCDGYWISSLTQSWQKGYPDNCSLPWSNYVDLVRRLRSQTEKKIVVDVDMLFNEPNIASRIASELYDVGADSIVIESKRFPKENSLIPGNVVLSTPEEFARLVNKVKTSVPKLEVISRNEYLPLTKDINATVEISKRTIDAGADGVIIHWGLNDQTSLLKETLSQLKDNNILTGIIPTKFLDQVVNREFDDLSDFSILGNICSSYIRNCFSEQNISKLLDDPPQFRSILDRVKSYEPSGEATLIVLGAKPSKSSGKYLLESEKVVEKFTSKNEEFYSTVFVIDESVKFPGDKLDKRIETVSIKNSLGELHSLQMSLPKINTEFTTIAYADIDDYAFENLRKESILFKGDKFAGVMNIKSETLISIATSADPTQDLIRLATTNKLI